MSRLPDRGPRSQPLHPPHRLNIFVLTNHSEPVDITTTGTQTEAMSSRA